MTEIVVSPLANVNLVSPLFGGEEFPPVELWVFPAMTLTVVDTGVACVSATVMATLLATAAGMETLVVQFFEPFPRWMVEPLVQAVDAAVNVSAPSDFVDALTGAFPALTQFVPSLLNTAKLYGVDALNDVALQLPVAPVIVQTPLTDAGDVSSTR